MDVVSSSSSAQQASSSTHFRYDIFLSFRGEDTRKNFTDHLYTALTDSGLSTFRDDDELPRGEDIKPELEKAIQHSRSSVIVFSKDYASSKWCLDELVMILLHKKTSGHVVLPVFYDIDPSHLRKQTGSVAVAFARHQKKSCVEKLNAWRTALAEVVEIAGMVLQNEADGYEARFIQKIVKVIEDKICRPPPLSVASHLIGVHVRVQDVNFWLKDGSSDVGVCLVYGIGGIGKTTLAQILYSMNLRRFEGCSFLENIRETSQGPNGLVQLQKQLLSDILRGRKVKIHSVSQGISMIRDAISSKKVLIVLDDVDHMSQFNAILSMRDSFHPGSKIIVTTRHLEIVEACQADKVHSVRPLLLLESLELFSRHAFGQDHPIQGYLELSQSFVRHIEGIPLALITLGSSLSGKSIDVWESALKKLRAIPNNEILHQLRISYDSLQDDHDKDLFLHIACFFTGKGKDVIIKTLDACEFYTIVGIENLIDRCLVTVDENNVVKMHQLIRDMGRKIVRLESKYPEKRSRLWHHKDSFNVLKEKSGSKKIEGLALDLKMYLADTPSSNSNKVAIETNAFTRMHRLRLLKLSHVQLNGCFEEFPDGLRWLCWVDFPLESMPVDFPLESLVVLEMQYSSLKRFWKGTKGVHEYGIFSTYIPGNETEVPGMFSYKIKGLSSLSFTVVSVPNLSIRGFNVFCVYYQEKGKTVGKPENYPPVVIQVCNKSKGLKWIYGPTCYGIPSDKKDVIWLSHWNFGDPQLEGGDEVSISMFTKRWGGIEVREWGIQIVHEEEDSISSQHSTRTDPGGELSELYEVMPGIYFLFGGPFLLDHRYIYNQWKTQGYYNGFTENSDKESADKEERMQGDGILASTEEAEAERAINNLCGCKILVIHMLMSLVEICHNIW